jgi:hypothetical protein
MKRTGVLLFLILLVSILLTAAAPGYEKLARLTVWNRTGSKVYIKLTTDKEHGDLMYYFAADDGENVYTVERALYEIAYQTCGQAVLGVADIQTQLSLTFVECKKQSRYLYEGRRWMRPIVTTP